VRGPPQGTTIHHHHTPGEVRMWVSNPGVVVLGNYSPQDIERLLESWGRMRDVVQGEDPSPVVFPDEAEA
jgi:hypothetical protein